jgi:transcriptional regulator with XRE-family HTH domain
MSVKVGAAIRRMRGRLRKSQLEFAEVLGSQRSSISRYEINLVQPSLPILWKLYNMAEKDEKETFEVAMREQIGTDLAGTEARIDAPMADLRRFAIFENRLEALYSWNRDKRRDFQKFLGAVLDLLTTARSIDSSIPEILRLWRNCAQNRGAAIEFRQAAAYLSVRLALPHPTRKAGQEIQHTTARTKKVRAVKD